MVVVLVGALPFARNLLDRRDEQLATNTRSPVSKTSQGVRTGRLTCVDGRHDPLLLVPKGARAIRLYPGYQGRRAPRLDVSVTGGGIELRGSTPAGYATGQPVVVALDREAPRRMTRVCVRNRGPVSVAIARSTDSQGNDAVGPLRIEGTGGGRDDRRSIRVDVIGRRDAIAATLVGGALDHASAFKPDGVGPAVIGGGLLLVLVLGAGAVALVARAPDDLEPLAAAAGPGAGPSGDDQHAIDDAPGTTIGTAAEKAMDPDDGGSPPASTSGGDRAGAAAAGGAIVGGAAACDEDAEPRDDEPADDEPTPGREGPHGGSWANDAHPGEADAAGPVDPAPSDPPAGGTSSPAPDLDVDDADEPRPATGTNPEADRGH